MEVSVTSQSEKPTLGRTSDINLNDLQTGTLLVEGEMIVYFENQDLLGEVLKNTQRQQDMLTEKAVEEISSRLESNSWARFLSNFGRSSVADTLRNLWKSFVHLRDVELPREVRWAEERAKLVQSRLDRTIAEAKVKNKKGMAIFMCPFQFAIMEGGMSLSNNTRIRDGSRYAYTYEGFPVFTTTEIVGPALLSAKATEAILAREKELAVREL